MKLRLWAIFALLMVGTLLNAALIWGETIPRPEEDEIQLADPEVARLVYRKVNRAGNLEKMGLSGDLLSAALDSLDRYGASKDAWFAIFDSDDTATVAVAEALCPGGALPQPYAGLGVLVRMVSDRAELAQVADQKLEGQPWYDPVLAKALYSEWELRRDRAEDATVMAVSAMLLNEPYRALKREFPWGRGIITSGGTDDVMREFPRAERVLPEYFALMHFLAELAADPDRGLCG